MNPTGDWYPTISNADHSLTEAVREAFSRIYSLRDSIGGVSSQIAALPPPPDLGSIAQSLSLGGSNPLNLEGLVGVLAQAQRSVTFGTHAKRLSLRALDYIQQLFVETDRNYALYFSTGKAWILIIGIGFGRFEDRWADLGNESIGALWVENSRLSIGAASSFPTWRWSGTVWAYVTGMLTRTQAQLAALLATLGSSDGGLLVYVFDFPHWLLWNTVSFQFGPGDPGSGYIVASPGILPFANLPSWGLCDGSTYAVLHADGNTSNITTPNLSNEVFIKGGAYTGNQQPATSPTWAPGAATDDEHLHTHSVSVPASTLATFNYQTGNSTEIIVGAASGTVTSSNGTPHTHNLSSNNAVLNPPSEGNNGLPLRIGLNWYLKR